MNATERRARALELRDGLESSYLAAGVTDSNDRFREFSRRARPCGAPEMCPVCFDQGGHRVRRGGDRWYRGVLIFAPNVHGMWSARVDCPGGGKRVAADTLAGIKSLVRDALAVTA